MGRNFTDHPHLTTEYRPKEKVAPGAPYLPASLNLIPQKLAEFIRRSELTQWFAVPSIFTGLEPVPGKLPVAAVSVPPDRKRSSRFERSSMS